MKKIYTFETYTLVEKEFIENDIEKDQTIELIKQEYQNQLITFKEYY